MRKWLGVLGAVLGVAGLGCDSQPVQNSRRPPKPGAEQVPRSHSSPSHKALEESDTTADEALRKAVPEPVRDPARASLFASLRAHLSRIRKAEDNERVPSHEPVSLDPLIGMQRQELAEGLAIPIGPCKELAACLRENFASVRKAKARDHVPYHEVVRVDPLRGMVRRQQRAQALPVPINPCRESGVCEFSLSFHKIPRGWRGGGANIRFRLGADDTVTSAEWFDTR